MNTQKFTIVGQCGKPMKSGNTQLLFLERLSRKLLNELLHRFSRYNNKDPLIVSDIQSERINNTSLNKQLKIDANIDMKGQYSPSLYIGYKDGVHNKQLFHVSIHLAPAYNSKNHNLIHFKNNIRRTTRKLRVYGHNTTQNAFCLNYRTNNAFEDTHIQAEADIVLKVLNSYFNPTNNKMYLGVGRTIGRDHTLLNIIEATMKQSLQTQSKSRTRKSQSSHSRNAC